MNDVSPRAGASAGLSSSVVLGRLTGLVHPFGGQAVNGRQTGVLLRRIAQIVAGARLRVNEGRAPQIVQQSAAERRNSNSRGCSAAKPPVASKNEHKPRSGAMIESVG